MVTAAAVMDTVALPRAFGRYVLFDHIGRGGMADIFLARAQTELGGGRLVVVKEVLEALSSDPEFARLLTAEAKLAARLSHANVVQVFDLGMEDGQLFIAMEYVEGFDLHQLLLALSRSKTPLPAEFALFVVREVLRGLDYAHRASSDEGEPLGIVHRDVSPSNVLVSFEGEVKLCDFGIAKAFGRSGSPGEERRIERTRVVGKSAYMSPEHARGEPIDARADIYSAGVLLWELCAGRRMYKGTEDEMLAMARAGVAPRLPERGLPRQVELARVIDGALASERQERFPTAKAFLDALEDYAVGAGLMASQIRFGSFLSERFGAEIISKRRARERAAETVAAVPRAPSVSAPEPRAAGEAEASAARVSAPSSGAARSLPPAPASRPAPPSTGIYRRASREFLGFPAWMWLVAFAFGMVGAFLGGMLASR